MATVQSPYDVPVMSVVPASVLEGPLQAHERDALKYLVNAVAGATPRVRAALFEHFNMVEQSNH